jgi:DNA-binding transcriptional LysR family regulator
MIKEFRSGSVSVASLPVLGLAYLPHIIAGFAKEHSDVSLSLTIRGSQSVNSLIGAQRADVGFAESIEFNDSVDAELILTSNLVCIMRPDHRLADKAVIEATDLDNEAFVRSNNWQLTYRDIDRYFDQHQVKRKIQIDTHQNASVAEFVLAGAGVGIIDPITADRFVDRGILVKPFMPSIPYNYFVIYPADKPRSLLVDQFVNYVKKDIVRFSSDNSS